MTNGPEDFKNMLVWKILYILYAKHVYINTFLYGTVINHLQGIRRVARNRALSPR